MLESLRKIFSSRLLDARFKRALFGYETLSLEEMVNKYLQYNQSFRPQITPYFDSVFYVGRYDDVRVAGMDPLLHFVEHGWAERRSPHPLIDLNYMAYRDPHIFASGHIDDFVEALEYDLVDASPYFNIEYYANQIGEKALKIQGMLAHYILEGRNLGLRPNPFLDIRWYVSRYDDVPISAVDAERHFALVGDFEARTPSPEFDGAKYAKSNPDVLVRKEGALRHFLRNGLSEGRLALPATVLLTDISNRQFAPVAALPQSIDAQASRASFTSARTAIAQVKQKRIERFEEVVWRPLLKEPKSIKFPVTRKPVISIIIPVYNEYEYTLECLTALVKAVAKLDCEIIIADDCSTDERIANFKSIKGSIRIIRGDENVGFLNNCNRAFDQCVGQYVLLLNNDAIVEPNSISELYNIMQGDQTIGAAGPKIIYPNGRMQEAGCFFRRNGAAGMVGLFEDSTHPIYSFDRDVQYCSGAALLIRKSAVSGVLFDERYSPAYYEDADICMRVREAGYRIRYVSTSVVRHYLSVSMAKESQSKKMQQIAKSRKAFVDRWHLRLDAEARIRPIAFYLPQFHPTTENDLWWGKGFTEWTNVSKAVPSFEGHGQPKLPSDLGFYDLRLTEVWADQAQLARRYGVEGFCVYYYNFGAKRVLDRAYEAMLKNKAIEFGHCVCWANENWTRHWDGGEKSLLLEQDYSKKTLSSIARDFARYAVDPRYIKVNGKAMFLIYRPLLIPDVASWIRNLRQEIKDLGGGDVYLVYVESMEAVSAGVRPEDICFDAAVEFPPQGLASPCAPPGQVLKPDWTGTTYDYLETIKTFCNRTDLSYKRHPSVFPDWDNTPRQPLAGNIFIGSIPEVFQAFVEKKLEEVRELFIGDEQLLFVNAWNEWAEGAILEPDVRYGHRRLDALRTALVKHNGGATC